MKKKALVYTLIATITGGLLGGCNTNNKVNSKNVSSANSTVKGEQIDLTVWHIASDEARHNVLKNAIERFESKYPNIKVTEVALENDPYKTKLATAMAAGEEPDIFISWGGGWLESFIDEGKVLDIDEWIDEVKDEYYEAALSLFEIDGKKYALPFSCGPAPVYYNKQIYSDLGLKVPKTFKELEEVCEVMVQNNIVPFALGNASQWPGALMFIWLSLRDGGKDAFINAYTRTNGGTFEDQSFIHAGHIIQDWVEKGYITDGCNGINFDTGGSRMLFYTGLAGNIISTNGMVGNAKSEASDFYNNNLGIYSFPIMEDGKGTEKEILGGGNGYSISASCEHPKEAFKLIRALSDKEFGQESVDSAGFFTGVKGVNISDPLIKEVERLISESSYIQNYYDQFLPTELGSLHKQTTYDLFGGNITPEQAAKDMEQKATEILGESK